MSVYVPSFVTDREDELDWPAFPELAVELALEDAADAGVTAGVVGFCPEEALTVQPPNASPTMTDRITAVINVSIFFMLQDHTGAMVYAGFVL